MERGEEEKGKVSLKEERRGNERKHQRGEERRREERRQEINHLYGVLVPDDVKMDFTLLCFGLKPSSCI